MSPVMAFRPMLVIPCYNHGAPLMAVLAELERRFAEPLPCLVVDDGSDLPTRRLLEQASARYSWLTSIALEQNQGKGRAVIAGLRHAAALGYSHGLQIDADGQHDQVFKFQECWHGTAEPLSCSCHRRRRYALDAGHHARHGHATGRRPRQRSH